MMVYLGGPGRGVSRPRLHDAPPGYRPPRRRLPVKQRQQKARQDYVLMRVATVVLVLTAAGVLVVICLMIALHS
jgi:hypothetical protein